MFCKIDKQRAHKQHAVSVFISTNSNCLITASVFPDKILNANK